MLVHEVGHVDGVFEVEVDYGVDVVVGEYCEDVVMCDFCVVDEYVDVVLFCYDIVHERVGIGRV